MAVFPLDITEVELWCIISSRQVPLCRNWNCQHVFVHLYYFICSKAAWKLLKRVINYTWKPWNEVNTVNSPPNNHDVEGICDTAAESPQTGSQRMSDGPKTQLLEVWRSTEGVSLCICTSAVWPLDILTLSAPSFVTQDRVHRAGAENGDQREYQMRVQTMTPYLTGAISIC